MTTANTLPASVGAQKSTAAINVQGSFGSSNLIEPSGPPTFNTGERIVSGSALKPELSPRPALPAANTISNGCDPVTPGSASRTAAS